MVEPRRPLLLMLGPDLRARGRAASLLRRGRTAGVDGGRPVRYLPTSAEGGPIGTLGVFTVALLRLAMLLARRRVAGLHAHSASIASFRRKSLLLGLARLAGKPYIVHLHGAAAFDRYHAGATALERAWIARTLRGARVVLVRSESRGVWLREAIGHPDVRVLPDPVLPEPLPADVAREPQTLLFLAPLEAESGVFVLIDALARLAGVRPALRLVLAGEGDTAAVRAAAAAAGVAARIELPGPVSGEVKAWLLARAGIFVLPSRCEAVPEALLEAQAAGLPVVAARAGDIGQVVDEDVNGRLCAPDDVASLVTALKPLLADAALARRMGEAGRRRVLEHYGIERVGALLAEAWRSFDAPPPGKE